MPGAKKGKCFHGLQSRRYVKYGHGMTTIEKYDIFLTQNNVHMLTTPFQHFFSETFTFFVTFVTFCNFGRRLKWEKSKWRKWVIDMKTSRPTHVRRKTIGYWEATVVVYNVSYNTLYENTTSYDIVQRRCILRTTVVSLRRQYDVNTTTSYKGCLGVVLL